MRTAPHSLEAFLRHEVVRYIINGLVATGVHFAVLQINIHLMGMKSAGAANFIAALFGISASFIGNRHFVFRQPQQPVLQQFSKFGVLYLAIAVLHGGILYVWTDLNGFNYNIGFILASIFQVISSYLGNKVLVFKK